MREIKIIDSISEISRADWDNCFPVEAEGYDYLATIEASAIPGFTYFYVAAYDNNKLLAAIPAFITDYKLDTTLQGAGKKITTAIKRIFPRFLSLKMACLGSPCTECTYIGFALEVSDQPTLTGEMLAAFETHAASRKCSFLTAKDVTEMQGELWKDCARKFTPLPGMPLAYLDIDFTTMDQYFTQLSYKTRKNMRQKLREAANVTSENRSNIDDVISQIMSMYHDTRSRSDWQFEELTPQFFQSFLQIPGAFCTLYYADKELLAANFFLTDGHTLIDKYFCMNSEKGRQHNLYFLSWFKNIQHCLDNFLTIYHSGQANYENKIKLGSLLIKTTMYFQHRNRVVNLLLRKLSPLFAADETV